MKKFIVFLAFMLMATPALASGTNGVDCSGVAALATSIMEVRQMGVPIAKVMAVAEAEGVPSVSKFLKAMVLEAYETPKYITEPVQAGAVEAFTTKMYLACVKAQSI